MIQDYNYIIEIIIWINIFLLFNIFFLYPAIISVAAKIFGKPVNSSEDYQPEITIIIAAYNEEKLIREAVESIYDSDYPINKMHVIIGSDGSTDRTVEILKELEEKYESLKYYEFDRSGKNYVLNQLVPKTNTDLIFYMDADLRIVNGTLSRMVKILSDEQVGAVLASIRIIGDKSDKTTGGFGESLYQGYETILRKNESRICSNINSLGTLYGIKREVYLPIPNDLVCDDLFRMLITATNKKRIIFDSESVVNEVREKSTREELVRRIRLAGGGLSTVWSCRKILNPKYGWISFFVWNHKVLRWLSPFYLIIIAAGTILLAGNSYLFYPLLISQIILYIGAFIGWLLEKMKLNFLPFRILLFTVSMNIGFLLGLIRFLGKGQNAKWERSVNN